MKQEGLGVNLSGVRIGCHQTRTIRKEAVWGGKDQRFRLEVE